MKNTYTKPEISVTSFTSERIMDASLNINPGSAVQTSFDKTIDFSQLK